MRAVFATLALPVLVMVGASEAEAYDRRIRLINGSDETIYEFHATNVRRRAYGGDILGSRTVPPGRAVIIDLDDGTGHCFFDFMTVMASGLRLYKRNVDVCTLVNYRITR